MATPDQEPRTGGVAVWRLPKRRISETAYLPEVFRAHSLTAPRLDAEPGIWFPLAQAEALIDPNDPAVRARVRHEIVVELHGSEAWEGTYQDAVHVADAVLAALQSKESPS